MVNECVMLSLYSGVMAVLHRLPGVLGWMGSKLRGVLGILAKEGLLELLACMAALDPFPRHQI